MGVSELGQDEEDIMWKHGLLGGKEEAHVARVETESQSRARKVTWG